MQDFTIALVQHGSPVGRTAENLAATAAWTRKAKRKGADLVCFPELGITGHAGHPAMTADAEPVPGGASCETLCELAAELDLYICAGICEDDRGIHYNTQFVVGPSGYVGKQRKVHLSGDEYFHFRGGRALPVFDLPFVRMGVVICYDNNFPEMSRCLAVDGAELIFAAHAARFGRWPRDAKRRRQIVARHKAGGSRTHAARAVDNGTYVVHTNTAGRSAVGLKGVEANHAGGILVFDPQGDLIAQSRTRDIRDEIVVTRLAAAPVHKRRAEKCFNLRVRRPEVFAALIRPTD